MKVLRCLVRGLSYNEIAKELGIEPSTVKYHVINMLQKTNLENKLQLAIAAMSIFILFQFAQLIVPYLAIKNALQFLATRTLVHHRGLEPRTH